MVKVMPLMTSVCPMADGEPPNSRYQKPVGEHGHRRGAGCVLGRRRHAAELGLNAQQRRRSWPTPRPRAPVGPRIGRSRWRRSRRRRRGPRRRATSRRQSRKLAGATERRVLSRDGFPHDHQAIGIAVRQRLQDAAVQHREDRRVGADAEGQRRHGRQREHRVSQTESQGEPQVVHRVCPSVRR